MAGTDIYTDYYRDWVHYRCYPETGEAVVAEVSGRRKIIEIPETIDGCVVTKVDNVAFKNLDTLEEVIFNTDVAFDREEAFDGCANLKRIDLPDGTIYI